MQKDIENRGKTFLLVPPPTFIHVDAASCSLYCFNLINILLCKEYIHEWVRQQANVYIRLPQSLYTWGMSSIKIKPV